MVLFLLLIESFHLTETFYLNDFMMRCVVIRSHFISSAMSALNMVIDRVIITTIIIIIYDYLYIRMVGLLCIGLAVRDMHRLFTVWASSKGHAQIVYRLIIKGADPKARNKVSNKTFMVWDFFSCICQCLSLSYAYTFVSIAYLFRNMKNDLIDLYHIL